MNSNASGKIALVVCPEGARPGRALLGLSLGERLLLALAHSGFDRVLFAGKGERPASARARLTPIELDDMPAEARILVVCSDLVFDHKYFSVPGVSGENLPLAWINAEEARRLCEQPEDWLKMAGAGRAEGGARFAIRVLDRRAAALARRALLKSLKKPIDGFVSRNLNRHVSLFFTRGLVRTGLSPNQLTVLIGLVGWASGLAVVFAEHRWALCLGALLFQMQSILDGCDGEVARLTFRFSKLGQWLDSVGDDLTNYCFCLGLAVGQARVTGWEWLYWFGGLTFLVQWAASGINYRWLVKLGTGDLLAIPDTVSTAGGDSAWGKVFKLLRQISKRDTFVFIVFVLVVAGLPLPALFFFAGGSYPMAVLVWINDRRLGRLEKLKGAGSR